VFGINKLRRSDTDSHDGSDIISKLKQHNALRLLLRIALHRTDALKLGGVACFLQDYGIRILVLFVPVILIKRSGKLAASCKLRLY
jgi:hypothetical protein